MTQISKATCDSGLNWFRLNLTKRKELAAFRNIIINKVDEANQNESVDCDDDENYIDCHKRQYLFPSNSTNVDGYYESVMNSIKFSCWVKCTEPELLDLLNELNGHQISADASRKCNSGVIRTVDENEVNTLKWIINFAPKNLFRANYMPSETKPAILPVPGGVILEGELSKMRGNVNTDKFYFSVLDTMLFMVISKGDAEEAGDFTQEIENIKKSHVNDKVNRERHWMVLRVSRGSEQYLEDRLKRWKKRDESDIFFETYLPLFPKDTKKGGKVISQRMSLLCPGYLFIRTSISEIIKIETDKFWDGIPISRFLVRQSMRKKPLETVKKKGTKEKVIVENRALTISNVEMTNFKFAVDSNLAIVTLDEEDYIDNELVRFCKPGDPFNQKIGRVLHKKDKLYLSLLPLGDFRFTQAFEINSSQIRKLSSKELAELEAELSTKSNV